MKRVCLLIAILCVAFSVTALAASISYFTDAGSFDKWYASSVKKMKNSGVMNGYPDGTFRPAKLVTRAELAVMFDRFAAFLGKKTYETGPVCTLDYKPGLTVILQDQKGNSIKAAKFSVTEWEGEKIDPGAGFTEKTDGIYDGLGEFSGYYTFKIEKIGFAPYVETVKLEMGDCHVLHQTKTITLATLVT